MSKYADIEQIKKIICSEWVKYMPSDLDINLSFVLGKIAEVPTIEDSEDCISREQVRAKLDYISYAEKDPISIAKRIVDNAPSVTPTERPKGKWIFKTVFPNDKSEFPLGYLVCPVCGSQHANATPCNYCDNCGAKMKGGTENE